MKIKTEIKKHRYGLLIVLFFSLFAWRNVLIEPGLVNYGDFVFPLILKNYLTHTYPLWKELWSYNNFQFFPRTVGYSFIMWIGFLPHMTPEIFERIFLIFIYSLSGISMYSATYLLLKEAYQGDERTEKLIMIASIASAIIYINNPYVINHIGHIYLRYSYALGPMILVSYIKMIHSEKYMKWLVLCGFLMALAAGTQHWIVFGPFLVGAYFFFDLILRRELKENIKRTSLLAIIWLGLVAYWLIPVVEVILTKGWVFPKYILSAESILSLHLKTNPYNVFTLMSFFWPKFEFVPSGILPRALWVASSLVLPISAFLAIAMRPKSKFVLFLAICVVLFTYLSLGMEALTPKFYYWLIFEAPYSGLYGWMFRDPNKWTQFLTMSYAFLSAFFVVEIFKRIEEGNIKLKKGVSLGCLSVLIVASMYFAWPGLTGDFNGLMSPSPVPKEYVDAVDYLDEHGDNYKVKWMPGYASRYATWNKKWTGHFDVFSSPIPAIGDMIFYSQYYSMYLYDVLLRNKTSNIGGHLAPANIKFIVFHNDTIEIRNFGKPNDPKVLESLLSQKDIKLVWKEGFMYIFENEKTSPLLYPSPKNFLAIGSIDLITSMNALDEFDANSSIVFINQLPTLPPSEAFDAVVFDSAEPYWDALGYFLPTTSLAEHTSHYNYRTGWSRTNCYTTTWHTHLSTFNRIDHWNFGYYKGLVLTYADGAKMSFDIDVPSLDRYIIGMRYFHNKNGGGIRLYIDGQPVIDVNSEGNLNDFVWAFSDVLTIDEGVHRITLENVEGFNAVNVITIAKTEEYEEDKKKITRYLENRPKIYLLEAESDLNSINANITDYNMKWSLGRAVELTNYSRVNADIHIIDTNPTYRLALKVVSEGSIVHVNVGRYSYDFEVNNSTWIYTPPMKLNELTRVEISVSNKVYLDELLLYSTENGDGIEDVVGKKESETKVEWEKKSDTEYLVHVKTENPFYLVFSNVFEPNWYVIIDGEKINNVITNTYLNGFYIDRVGEYSFTLTYYPERFATYGWGITFLTLLFCILLIYRER